MPGVARPHVRIQVAQGIQLAQLEGLLKNIVASQPGAAARAVSADSTSRSSSTPIPSSS